MAGGRGRESAFSGAEVCLGMVAWGFRVGTYKVQDWKLSFDSMGTSSEAFFLSLARRQTRCSVFTKYAWRRLAHRECIYIYMHVYIYIYDIYIYIYIYYMERERERQRERERENENTEPLVAWPFLIVAPGFVIGFLILSFAGQP